MDELKIDYVDITTVQQHPNNANNGDMNAIKDSIRVNGLYQPIVVQRSTNYILAGNHRYMALMEQGNAEVPVIYVDVDDMGATRIMLADNRTTRLGRDDPGILSELLQTVYHDDTGLAGTGYTHDDYTSILDFASQPWEGEEPPLPESHGFGDKDPFEMEVLEGDEKDRPTVVSIFKPGGKHLTMGEFNSIRKALGMAPMTPEQASEYGYGFGR